MCFSCIESWRKLMGAGHGKKMPKKKMMDMMKKGKKDDKKK